MQPKVKILLSSYNGERYIREQIDSILNQKNVSITILIRDDGSTDSTRSIIQEYADKDSRIQWYSSSNLGAAQSFFHLISHCENNAEFYAFSDQDDVWQPEKLSHAIKILQKMREKHGSIALYASQVTYASEDLHSLEPFAFSVNRAPDVGNALLENICIGCTEVFTAELLSLIKDKNPGGIIWHDWWLYLTASVFGNVYYDKNSFIYYRQHNNNEVGMQNTWGQRWKKRIRSFQALKGRLSTQARSFIQIYGKRIPNYDTIKIVADCDKGIKYSWRAFLDKNLYRQNPIDNIIFHLLMLLGLL
ncbi:MAG: glycosyltransferase family 2 protein [Lachnospiraceae bacterium]